MRKRSFGNKFVDLGRIHSPNQVIRVDLIVDSVLAFIFLFLFRIVLLVIKLALVRVVLAVPVLTVAVGRV